MISKRNTKSKNDISLILSSVRALWGVVTPSVRSVSTEIRNDTIIWQCIFDIEATEEEMELMSDAASEVISDFNNLTLDERIIKIHSPIKIDHLKNLIFLRKEE